MRLSFTVLLVAILIAPVAAGAPAGDPNRGITVGPATPQPKGELWAVVIGVTDYVAVPKLPYAAADAVRVHDLLQKQCGYFLGHTVLLTDLAKQPKNRPTRQIIIQRMTALLAQPSPADTVLVFFAGRACQDVIGRGYLAPLDVDLSNLSTRGISLAHLKQMLKACKARNKVVILDTARGPAPKGLTVGPSPELDAIQVLTEAGTDSTIIWVSCGPGERSHVSPKWQQSVFVRCLIDGLKGKADVNKDKRIEFRELERYVVTETGRHAKQQFAVKQVPMSDVRIKNKVLVTRVGATPPPPTNPPITPPVNPPVNPPINPPIGPPPGPVIPGPPPNPGPSPGEEFGLLKGVVVDRKTKRPIGGAVITFREEDDEYPPRRTVTDRLGRFALWLQDGDWDAFVKFGNRVVKKGVDVDEGEEEEVTIKF